MLLAGSMSAADIMMVIFGIIVFLVGLLTFVVARRLVRGEVSMNDNRGMGLRIKEALASDEAWYRINREGAKLLIVPSEALMFCSLALVFCTLIVPSLARAVLIVTISWMLLMTLKLLWYVIRVKRTEPGRHAA